MKNQIVIVIITMFGLASCMPTTPAKLPTEYPSPTHFFALPVPTFTPTPTNSIPINNEAVLLDFALSQDETKVAVYTTEEVFIYNFVTHEKTIIKSFENNIHADNLSGAIAFNPNNSQIAVSDLLESKSIEIWNLTPIELQRTFSDTPTGYQIKKIDFTPNGKNILARISESSCKNAKESFILFSVNGESNWSKSDISSLELNHYCDPYNYPHIIFRFTNDSRLFIFQFSPQNAPVLIFDANTGQYISQFSRDDKQHFRIYYDVSRDGKTLAAEASSTTYITDIDTGEEIEFQGLLILLDNKNRFLVNNFSPAYWYLSENGKSKCAYSSTYYGPLTDRVRISTAKNIFASYAKGEFQVWKISNCELLYVLPIKW